MPILAYKVLINWASYIVSNTHKNEQVYLLHVLDHVLLFILRKSEHWSYCEM